MWRAAAEQQRGASRPDPAAPVARRLRPTSLRQNPRFARKHAGAVSRACLEFRCSRRASSPRAFQPSGVSHEEIVSESAPRSLAAAFAARRRRAGPGHAEEDQGQRQRSRWACASRRARCRTRSATASTPASTYDVCQRVIADIQKQLGLAKLDIKYQPVTSQNRIPLVQNGTVDIECGSTTNNATRQKDVAFAPTTYVEEVRIAVKANSGINVDRRPERQERRHHHRHDLGAAAAQERARRRHRLQGGLRQGPRRQLPAARVGPRRRLRDGRPDPGRPTSPSRRTRPTSRSSARCCRSSRSRS